MQNNINQLWPKLLCINGKKNLKQADFSWMIYTYLMTPNSLPTAVKASMA